MFPKVRPWLRFIEGTEGGQTGGGEPNDDNPENNANNQEPSGSNNAEEDDPDWKAKADEWKKYARTWENRAKENQDKAKRLDEIEEQSKSDLEKANERIAELEEKLSGSDLRSMRADVASEFGVSKEDRDLYLTATDEETLRKQAEGLANRGGPENPHQGRGNSGPNRQSAEEWAKSLL